MKRILCLWLPDWSAQRVLSQRGVRPLALHTRDPRHGERIAVCNEAAQALGVQRGMPLDEAKALGAHAGQQLMLAAYDAAADQTQLRELAIHCERYSPLVGLASAYPPPAHDPGETFDGLLLDVTSIGALFGGEASLATSVQNDLAAQGFATHIAIADTVATAWGLAHFPHSQTICAQGWPALQLLPIEALRLPAEQAATLRQLGVETIAHLADLPREALATRFGRQMVTQLDRAEGLAEELLTPIRPPAKFQAEWPLEYPISDRLALEKILEELTQRVADALRRQDHGAVQLVCRLDIAESVPRYCQIDLFRPRADARHFMELLRLQGEALRLKGAVGRIGLAAPTTARLEQRQKHLFAGTQEQQAEELALLINRLSNRLGREQVTRPQLTGDAVPEHAYRLQPLAGQVNGAAPPPRKRSSRKAPPRAGNDDQDPAVARQPSATRPLLLLPKPIELLQAVSIAMDGPPASFVYQGQHQRIARHWGPERIETAWWRGASVRRDYYRVETAEGRRFWVFRERSRGAWFLHGHFD